MPPIPRHQRLVDKAEAALLAAIEAYNKPDAPYREETFAILMINAWELLLKGKLVHEHDGNPRCMCVYESRSTKKGGVSKKRYLKRNRTGQPFTKDMYGVIAALDGITDARVPLPIKHNLDALLEIRDNAIHFYNPTPKLARLILEIGTAAVCNFVALARLWFKRDLSRYSLYLLPVGFLAAPLNVKAVSVAADEAKLVEYLADLMKEGETHGTGDFRVGVELELKFRRAKPDATAAVAVTKDPSAPKVILSEEDIRATYPWSYDELVRRCRKRYSDFSVANKFHALRKPLTSDPGYTHLRFLDPGNPKSSTKAFYNPNILQVLDRHYTRRD